ncbi:phage tail protein [Candidatus Enterococcus ikei]|uniref:Phage tail protein n=1 Tax=Candidatus Enterococcus ikei TaxID=2815326 RepID=A0ABS3GXE8_9ENTE|nr:phage tail protein [Enterococcus sp. DIV0869a]MBO0439649.1 phage tail protein [Enterococcus sp. DIV0869a]
MSYKVDFKSVSTIGFESSPVADALAGLRANEARYYWNKYKHEFVTVPASADPETLAWIEKILAERDMYFPYKPLEISSFEVDGIKMAYVFYENGLAVNVMYTLEKGGKRAVGFKLSDGMDIPVEFEGKFKFVRQKSKLAGTIRGSFFVIKGDY